MSDFLFMLPLSLGVLILGVGLGAFLHALDAWSTKRRMKNAKIFRIKF